MFFGIRIGIYQIDPNLLPKHLAISMVNTWEKRDGHVSIGQRVGEFYAIFCGWLVFAAVKHRVKIQVFLH